MSSTALLGNPPEIASDYLDEWYESIALYPFGDEETALAINRALVPTELLIARTAAAITLTHTGTEITLDLTQRIRLVGGPLGCERVEVEVACVVSPPIARESGVAP